jgi:hypothetical protein
MSSRTRLILVFSILSLSAFPALGQQSIAESVAQLKVDVANLQRGLPAAAPNQKAPLSLTDIDFTPGVATFKNPNGTGIALLGNNAEGAGGLWLRNGLGKQIFTVGTQKGTNRPEMEMITNELDAIRLQTQDNGNGVSRFFGSNGKEVATLGGNTEGTGGAAWLADANGNNVAYIGASSTGIARLALSKPNGTVIAVVDDESGGRLSLYSGAGKAIVAIGNSIADSGYASFYNASGDEIVSIGTLKTDQSRGTVWVKGQDYAEVFDAASAAEASRLAPGSVVSASADGSGIVLAGRAYDPAVVGVLSGAGGLHPAMVAGGSSDSKTPPVAIAGQIYVRISTEGGAIQVGDLLVSSSTPGAAMRAADPSHAIGAIIGKALQNYSAKDEGLIRMLVLNR